MLFDCFLQTEVLIRTASTARYTHYKLHEPTCRLIRIVHLYVVIYLWSIFWSLSKQMRLFNLTREFVWGVHERKVGQIFFKLMLLYLFHIFNKYFYSNYIYWHFYYLIIFKFWKYSNICCFFLWNVKTYDNKHSIEWYQF